MVDIWIRSYLDSEFCRDNEEFWTVAYMVSILSSVSLLFLEKEVESERAAITLNFKAINSLFKVIMQPSNGCYTIDIDGSVTVVNNVIK